MKNSLCEKVDAALLSERRAAVTAWRRKSLSDDPGKIDIYTHIASAYDLLHDTANEIQRLEARVRKLENALGLGTS
jgi:hypothetical protein